MGLVGRLILAEARVPKGAEDRLVNTGVGDHKGGHLFEYSAHLGRASTFIRKQRLAVHRGYP